jgi:hypothetical protein
MVGGGEMIGRPDPQDTTMNTLKEMSKMLAPTNKTRGFFSALAAALVMSVASPAAAAEGVAIDARVLPAQARASLLAQITKYKVKNPAIFQQVRSVKGHRPELYMKFRNPVPLVGRELRHLGSDALLPMLEALAFDAPPVDGLKQNEIDALRVGLLEAVGMLRDGRSEAVLEAVFAGDHSRWVNIAAAEAVGRLCTTRGLSRLASALDTKSRNHAIAGLGQCRKHKSAELLAGLLDKTKTASEADTIAAAMGSIGSRWAWRALARRDGKTRLAEGEAVRTVIAEALVRNYDRFSGETRKRHREAISMVAITGLRGVVARHASRLDAASRAELEVIAARLERRAKC